MVGVAGTLTIEPRVSIDDAPVRAMLARLSGFGDDGGIHPALDAIGDAMVASTKNRFYDQHGPGGAPWPPSKAALREKRKTLIKSGRLLNSISHNVLASNSGVEWGTNAVYAAMMQRGGTFTVYARSQQIYRKFNKRTGELGTKFVKKSKSNFASWHTIGQHNVAIPGWPFIGIDNEDIAEMSDVLTRYLRAAMQGSGRPH